MDVIGRVIRKREVPDIAADREAFRRVFEDMRRAAGPFTPTPGWLLYDHPQKNITENVAEIVNAAGSDEVFDEQFSTLSQAMFAWLGSQTIPISDPSMSEVVNNYAALLRNDRLGLWRANVDDPSVAARLKVTDLGSIMDLNFLYGHSFDATRKITRILEVGGGYGRLAEAAFNVFGKSIRYVLIDSVPVSLYYAKKYLERACPEIRVGSYYDGDPFDLDAFDCSILPSWYFEQLNHEKYDICINIESFQEMHQEHVDIYLKMFDMVAGESSTIYVSNAHDYIFRGVWNYPRHWRKTLCANTPRSWTADHPTELFVKDKGDFSMRNALIDDTHKYLVRPKIPSILPLDATRREQVKQSTAQCVKTIIRKGLSLAKENLAKA